MEFVRKTYGKHTWRWFTANYKTEPHKGNVSYEWMRYEQLYGSPNLNVALYSSRAVKLEYPLAQQTKKQVSSSI